jgi:NADH:ubiquinone oxidoreductase subunit E/NAD-dependent dihydropyrimidine dehydrogenase PreA subunit
MNNNKIGAAMVVGGGIGGMQAALDLADSGIKVYLVEKSPCIGGVMAQLDKTFPTNDCSMCIMAPKLVEVGRHKDIELITLSDVEKIEGQAGHFSVEVKKRPRYIDEDKCTGCGLCMENCPVRNVIQLIPPEEQEKVELSPEIQERVSKIVRKHKNRKGPLMPILQEISAYLKYFPEDVLKYVSQETGYSLAHICRIATFYSAFSLKPIGKHIINVCMGTACYVKGAERLLDRFSEILEINEGETTSDRLFTLRSVRCIGCCGLSPVAMIGEDVYGKLQVKDIEGIVKKYREKEAA